MTLHTLQKFIIDILTHDKWLTKRNIAVIAENVNDLESAIQAQVAKMGLVLSVATPGVNSDAPDAFQAKGVSNVVITCYEMPIVNRANAGRATALDAAERVACVLSMITDTRNERIGPPSFVKIESGVSGQNKADTIIFHNVHFRVMVALSGDIDAEPPTQLQG